MTGPWLEETALVVGVLALAGAILALAYRLARLRLELRQERERTLRELLGRMEPPERAVAFLASPEGRALLGEPRPGDRERLAVRVFLGAGAVLGSLGLALVAVAGLVLPGAGPEADRTTTLAWGVVLLGVAAGAGLLAAVVRAGRRDEGARRGDG
ncbi:MAG: hypothetical protein QM704_22320 [Anaeromyxobacteraceae bacterium]